MESSHGFNTSLLVDFVPSRFYMFFLIVLNFLFLKIATGI